MSYADIDAVETTGASPGTSQQDKLSISGVAASHNMAKTDVDRVKKYKSKIESVAEKSGIDAALIAAIMSRETRAGNVLNNGWGDHGNAWGLMQVDVNPNGGGHTAQGAWDSEEHITQATGILVYFIDRISKKFPSWSKEMQLKGGIAAYNAGDGSVRSEDVDARTTGKDYSNDVIARAQWYRTNVFPNFVIGSEGHIYESRGWKIQGRHTKGHNSIGYGVSVIGNYNYTLPSVEAMDLIRHRLYQCAVDGGGLIANFTLHGHRQVVDTDCPGDAFFEEIKTWEHFRD